MVKHIVMWRIQPPSGETKEEAAFKIKNNLEQLNGKIEGLIHLEVGIDFKHAEKSFDAVLYSEFESEYALEHYHHHPLHNAVANKFVRPITISRNVVDYKG
ncbi:MAG: stress responsive protein [Clostridia bacterium]|jgi:hypothetical protein|nr:stress responsive protein [Clostridia bacterium]